MSPPTPTPADGDGLRSLFKIRTITLFINAVPATDGGWAAEFSAAAAAARRLEAAFAAAGYAVQTVRFATRALASVAHDAREATRLAVHLERLALKEGVEFLSLGAASGGALLEPGVVAGLAAALTHTSFSYAFRDGVDGAAAAARLGAEVVAAAAATGGDAPFRFGVSFQCAGRRIPFFPAASADARAGAEPQPRFEFALGTENSGLLREAVRRAVAAGAAAAAAGAAAAGAAAAGAAAAGAAAAGAAAAAGGLATLRGAVVGVWAEALGPLQDLALEVERADAGAPRFVGIDASVAPALEGPSIASSFELLPEVARFGGGGTLAAVAKVTAGVRGAPLRLCGYSGLMLPVAEDAGLAAAAAEGRLSVQTLLLYSSVCGCGLDCVPVPGARAGAPAEVAAAAAARVAAALLDTAALAGRLRKPLSARLLPAPGGAPGDAARFASPYLCPTRVMPL